MFHDLHDTLKAMLEAELQIEKVNVTFASPEKEYPPSTVSLPAIAFFLYDVRENYELRSNEWDLRRENGSLQRRPPPVRVDCSYLITFWPGDGGGQAQDEYRVLGEVLRVLLRHQSIPATYLQGELADQDPPARARFIAENQLHSLGEFWQAMGGKPKTTLHYAVTLSVDVFDPAVAGPEVRENVIRLRQGLEGP